MPLSIVEPLLDGLLPNGNLKVVLAVNSVRGAGVTTTGILYVSSLRV